MNSHIMHFFILEDMPRGDITSRAVFGKNCSKIVKANFLAKQDLVVSGFSSVKKVLEEKFPDLKLEISKQDGSKVSRNTVLARLSGPVGGILLSERLCLNLLQHLSGIATFTSKFVSMAKGRKSKIFDTRKTLPGLRFEEKKAVRDGGGGNHRMSLSDQYLIKDNHVKVAGSVTKAILAVQHDRRRRRGKEKIEVEVKNISEFKEALALHPDIILLDNFRPAQIKKAVKLRNAQDRVLELEISGGVNLRTLKQYLHLGVERISIGALTHSAPAADISMKIQ